MLTRLYIDNFRCLVDFEYRPARKQLILGANGAGKSTVLDVLLFVRQFATSGNKLDEGFLLAQRTRWLQKRELTCELEAILDDHSYLYRLIIAPSGYPELPSVSLESVHVDGRVIFQFEHGDVQLFNDSFEPTGAYTLDASRSALASLPSTKEDMLLTRLRKWLGALYCFRIDPFHMPSSAPKEDLSPKLDLSNFAAWYRHLLQANPGDNVDLLESLRSAIQGFGFLGFEPIGENVRVLFAEVGQKTGSNVRFYFNELSEGQRCLICLYTILSFVLARGSTVILDEPDNFISLREIQPWLMRATDAVEEGHGQILLISHHPELINQWAPNCGVQLTRDGSGAVQIEKFQGERDSALSPAELVARGWERE